MYTDLQKIFDDELHGILLFMRANNASDEELERISTIRNTVMEDGVRHADIDKKTVADLDEVRKAYEYQTATVEVLLRLLNNIEDAIINFKEPFIVSETPELWTVGDVTGQTFLEAVGNYQIKEKNNDNG